MDLPTKGSSVGGQHYGQQGGYRPQQRQNSSWGNKPKSPPVRLTPSQSVVALVMVSMNKFMRTDRPNDIYDLYETHLQDSIKSYGRLEKQVREGGDPSALKHATPEFSSKRISALKEWCQDLFLSNTLVVVQVASAEPKNGWALCQRDLFMAVIDLAVANGKINSTLGVSTYGFRDCKVCSKCYSRNCQPGEKFNLHTCVDCGHVTDTNQAIPKWMVWGGRAALSMGYTKAREFGGNHFVVVDLAKPEFLDKFEQYSQQRSGNQPQTQAPTHQPPQQQHYTSMDDDIPL